MKQSNALTAMLSSVGLFSVPARSAEDVAADRVTGLNEIGTISVNNMVGSPLDVEKAIARQATQQGAAYYRIIQLHENPFAESWQVQAIIYA